MKFVAVSDVVPWQAPYSRLSREEPNASRSLFHKRVNCKLERPGVIIINDGRQTRVWSKNFIFPR